MKNSNSTRPNLLKIIQDNYYNKQRQIRSGGTPASLRSNPYMYNVNPNVDMQDYYNYGGTFLSERAKATQFGQYAYGGEPCPPGYGWDGELEECVKLPQGVPQPGQNTPIQSIPSPSVPPPSGGGFNAGLGLEGNRYNLDYGFGVGADMKSDVKHNLSLNFPGLFRMGVNKGDLGIKGAYVPGRNWSGNLTAGFPISGKKGRADILKFTGGIGQKFNNSEVDNSMNPPSDDFMKINQKKNPVSYNAGLEYSGKMFGEKGPNVKIRASYDRQEYGGTPEYKRGGGYFPEYHSYAPPRMDDGGYNDLPPKNWGRNPLNPMSYFNQEKPLESGWVVDRATGKAYIIKGGKPSKSYGVITGKSTEGNINPVVFGPEENMRVEDQATVPGYYRLNPQGYQMSKKDIERHKNRIRVTTPISAFGYDAPNASGISLYQTEPAVHKNDFVNYPNSNAYVNAMRKYGTHGCIGTNCNQPEDWNDLNNANLGSDTLRVYDSRTLEGKKYKKLYGLENGGDISIPDLNEDFSYMYPNGGGFPRTTAAYVSPSVSAGMRQMSSVPPPVSQYIPKGIMSPAASESTARSFYNPMLGRQTSTATTGVSASNMASSTSDMSKGKRAEERERMKTINESNQAIAAKDKGAPFTFSNGQTKTWDQMDAREKAYVSGSALKNRYKMFPNEDSPVDRFLNPFNFLIGRVSGNLGTAPYEAKESHSVVPYITSIGEPLALGAIAHAADPKGTLGSWTKELMNPVPGLFKKHAVNAGEKLGAGMIAAKNLASMARHKGIEEGRTELIQHAREHATEHGAEHEMGGGIYAYADGGSNKRDLSVVNYLASTGRAFDKASRKKLAESMGIKGYSGTPNQNIKLLNMIIDRDEANMNNQSGVPYDNTPSPRQQPVFNSPTSFAVPQFGRSAAPQKVRTAMTPSVPVVGTDSGFRPYSPENNWQYNIPGVTTSTAPSKQPKTAKQAAAQKTKQADTERKQRDLRNLESGMITDKGTNMMHVIKNGKVVQSFPVLTGQDRNANENPLTMGATKATPTGTYISQPRSNLYGDKGFHMSPVPAFGQPAPLARGVAQHVTYGANGVDPKEFNRRNALYDQPADKRAASYGCINCKKPNLDYITNAFPQGDTTLVIDSRKAADAQLLKNKFKIKKNGGESDGTYYQGTYFGQGGSFVPEFYSPEYGLPQFMYGVGMQQGGLVKGGEYDMTEEEIQNLIDQGYKIQYI